MTDNLSEIFERLNWARAETSALEGEITAWWDRSFRVSEQPDGLGHRLVFIETSEALPIGVRSRSGTITNEIRSCLDSLASTLAERNAREGAYFPVADDEAAFETNKKLRERLKKFTPADRDALLAFRPFAIGKDGKAGNPLLYDLHHADIKRKHHKLVAKAATTRTGFVEGRFRDLTVFGGKLSLPGKTLIARMASDSFGSMRFEPVLSYAEPNVLRGRSLVPTLNDFADIAETVVRAFL